MFLKIGEGIDIKGPKIGGPSLDIHGPKLDAGLDINTPKIGIPDLVIHGGKIGGNIDIKEPKIDVPKIGLDIKRGPKFRCWYCLWN